MNRNKKLAWIVSVAELTIILILTWSIVVPPYHVGDVLMLLAILMLVGYRCIRIRGKEGGLLERYVEETRFEINLITDRLLKRKKK